MSYTAMSWAMGQPVSTALTKFLLVAMAECVNSENADMVCWPSYAYLARRTGMNTKTVEAGVSRLKEEHFIVDTGKREGGTGKVVVYRLNNPAIGVIQPGPQLNSASGTRPQTSPETGALPLPQIPPIQASNPPNSGGQSPQIVEVTTPKTGGGIGNGIRKRIKKEPGDGASPPSVPDVPADLLSDYLAVRKAKRAGPLTDTAIAGLRREAALAGITLEQAVRACCEFGWQGFNAGWYADRQGRGTARAQETGETAFQRSKREAVERATGGLAARKPTTTEVPHVARTPAARIG